MKYSLLPRHITRQVSNSSLKENLLNTQESKIKSNISEYRSPTAFQPINKEKQALILDEEFSLQTPLNPYNFEDLHKHTIHNTYMENLQNIDKIKVEFPIEKQNQSYSSILSQTNPNLNDEENSFAFTEISNIVINTDYNQQQQQKEKKEKDFKQKNYSSPYIMAQENDYTLANTQLNNMQDDSLNTTPEKRDASTVPEKYQLRDSEIECSPQLKITDQYHYHCRDNKNSQAFTFLRNSASNLKGSTASNTTNRIASSPPSKISNVTPQFDVTQQNENDLSASNLNYPAHIPQQDLVHRELNELIEQLMSTEDSEDNEYIEDVILQLNRISRQNNGVVPQRIINNTLKKFFGKIPGEIAQGRCGQIVKEKLKTYKSQEISTKLNKHQSQAVLSRQHKREQANTQKQHQFTKQRTSLAQVTIMPQKQQKKERSQQRSSVYVPQSQFRIYKNQHQKDQYVAKKEQQIDQTKRAIRELKGQQSKIVWALEKKEKQEELRREISEKKDQQEYYNQMRDQFIDFIQSKEDEDNKLTKQRNKDKIMEMRLEKLKKNAEYRIQMIEDFKRTLNNMDWNRDFRVEDEKFRLEKHFQFLNDLKVEKQMKKEVELIEKIMMERERIEKRRKDVDFEHKQMLEKQIKLMDEVELMIKLNTK